MILVDCQFWQVRRRMVDLPGMLVVVPIKMRVFHLRVDACSFFVPKLLCKLSHTHDIDRRLGKVQYFLEAISVWYASVILPSPLNGSNARWLIEFATDRGNHAGCCLFECDKISLSLQICVFAELSQTTKIASESKRQFPFDHVVLLSTL